MKPLTLWQTVLQSQKIHPDWKVRNHIEYLKQTGANLAPLRDSSNPARVVSRWLADNVKNGNADPSVNTIVLVRPGYDSDLRIDATSVDDVRWAWTSYSNPVCIDHDCGDDCEGPHPYDCEACELPIFANSFWTCLDNGGVNAHKDCVATFTAHWLDVQDIHDGNLISHEHGALEALHEHNPDAVRWNDVFKRAERARKIRKDANVVTWYGETTGLMNIQTHGVSVVRFT